MTNASKILAEDAVKVPGYGEAFTDPSPVLVTLHISAGQPLSPWRDYVSVTVLNALTELCSGTGLYMTGLDVVSCDIDDTHALPGNRYPGTLTLRADPYTAAKITSWAGNPKASHIISAETGPE